MTDLPTILARLEEATGPDRELDGAIALALGGFHLDKEGGYAYWDGNIEIRPGHGEMMNVPRSTASIDAAIGLVERELPGWNMALNGREENWVAGIQDTASDKKHKDRTNVTALAKSAPLAILSALLRAKIAEQEKVA